jgi:hypothetical protein
MLLHLKTVHNGKYRDSGANSLELSRSDFDPGRIISNGNATLNGINSLKLELVSSMKVLKVPLVMYMLTEVTYYKILF